MNTRMKTPPEASKMTPGGPPGSRTAPGDLILAKSEESSIPSLIFAPPKNLAIMEREARSLRERQALQALARALRAVGGGWERGAVR